AINDLLNTNLPLFAITGFGATAAQRATGSFKSLTDGNGNEVQSVSFGGSGTAILSLGSFPGSTPLPVSPSINEVQRLSFTGTSGTGSVFKLKYQADIGTTGTQLTYIAAGDPSGLPASPTVAQIVAHLNTIPELFDSVNNVS